MALLAGCGSTATPTPGLPTLQPTAETIPTNTPTLVPTNTPAPTNTSAPTLTPTSVVNFAPTFTPAPTGTPVPTPITLLKPGNVAAGVLQTNDPALFFFETARFETLFFLVRAGEGLDIALAAYGYDALEAAGSAGLTLEQGLAQFAPDRLVENSAVGVPEFMVYTPGQDGLSSLGVGGIDGTAGPYKIYLFDTITQTVNTPVVQTDTVSAGAPDRFPVQSRGARPIAVFVDPIGRVDVALRLETDGGETVVSSDFGGAGSPEAAFVRPGTQVNYTAVVSTNSTAVVSYNIVIVAIVDDIQ